MKSILHLPFCTNEIGRLPRLPMRVIYLLVLLCYEIHSQLLVEVSTINVNSRKFDDALTSNAY